MSPIEATKIGPNGQIVIPRHIREAAGLRTGDFVEARLGPENTVILKAKVPADRDVERDIAASEAALNKGRVLGPFDSVSQVRQALKDYQAKIAPQRRSSKKQSAQRAARQRAHARNST